MGTVKDISNQKFGKLRAIRFSHLNDQKAAYWECLCDCGGIRLAKGTALRSGLVKSCGCQGRGAPRKYSESTRTVEYRTWIGILDRCNNPKNKSFPRYGGRGIFVCERWSNNYELFLSDVGRRPAGTSIDRIDNDGPYSPENCRWATPKEQVMNREISKFIWIDGQKMSINDACQLKGLSPITFRMRLRRGWQLEAALNSPAKSKERAA